MFLVARKFGVDQAMVDEAHEALTVLLSAIISSLYTAPDGQEPIQPDGNWYSIGDCKIMVSGYNFKDGNYAIVFQIKS